MKTRGGGQQSQNLIDIIYEVPKTTSTLPGLRGRKSVCFRQQSFCCSLTLVVGGRGPAVVLPEHDVQRLQRSQLVLVTSATTAARGRCRGRGGRRGGGRGVPPLSTPSAAAAASSRSLLSRVVEGAGTRGKLHFRPAGTNTKIL